MDSEITERIKGYRIVTGGQTDSGGSWEVSDVETGELLAEGVGLDSYRAAWQDSWLHEDRIAEDWYAQVDEPTGAYGLPTELAEVLTEWVVDKPHEARQFLGLDGERP